MFKKAKGLSLILVLTIGLWGGFLLPCFSQSTETLTITTYYPSPFGVYGELRTKRMAIGDTYYDPSQHCWPGGSCAFPDINANTDLEVEGDIHALGSICSGSSRDFKEDIRPFKEMDYQSLIDKLKGIDIVYYKFKGRKNTHIGVIAEDAPSEIVNSAKKLINIPNFYN